MNTICIMCPMGCGLNIEQIDGKVVVKGNTCPAGEKYGVAEFTHPRRNVTTLIRLESGGIASCRTSDPVPKERVADVVKHVGELRASDSLVIGDVIERNVLGLGVDLLLTGRS